MTKNKKLIARHNVQELAHNLRMTFIGESINYTSDAVLKFLNQFRYESLEMELANGLFDEYVMINKNGNKKITVQIAVDARRAFIVRDIVVKFEESF